MRLFNLSGRDALENVHSVTLSEWKDGKVARAISLDADIEIDDIDLPLEKIDLIILNFPIFRDGRVFTQARSLREYYQYQGEIRACGNVLPDQAIHLKRCGFDTVIVDNEAITEEWKEQLNRYQFYYQHIATDS